MPRKLFQRLAPPSHRMREHQCIRMLGNWLQDPDIWHVNRHSVAGAFAVGLFIAFAPIPFQMFIAAALAILFRVNLPVSVTLVWVTNPLTFAPIFIVAHHLGERVLDRPPTEINFEMSWAWLSTELANGWRPLATGCFILSVSTSLLGYFGIQLFWRIHVMQKYRRRSEQHRKSRPGNLGPEIAHPPGKPGSSRERGI